MGITKSMIATRDFTDAGDGKAFTAGNPVEVDAGTMANYAAAGLVAVAETQPEATAA